MRFFEFEVGRPPVYNVEEHLLREMALLGEQTRKLFENPTKEKAYIEYNKFIANYITTPSQLISGNSR